MIHLFFNAWAASAGAGLTYVRNIVPEISTRKDVRATIVLTPALRREFADPKNVAFIEFEPSAAASRFWREQRELPQTIRRAKADVLISTGNFALRKSPVPQILLSGNSLYTSSDFSRDVLDRRDYGAWVDARVKGFFARRSIFWADKTVAPSQAFADVLQKWTRREVLSIFHGFNRHQFFENDLSLPPDVQGKINAANGALKLLFVSHYNYYRNFETLLRAIPLLRQRLPERKIKLFLTCKLHSADNPGSYKAESASALVQELNIADEVVQLGAIPYNKLHHVYRAADIYVTPAYAETFAHPLVEAMASSLPVVASDTPVHREICAGSAVFFDRFSPVALADQVINVSSSADLMMKLKSCGEKRSLDFSWREHVDKILQLAQDLVARQN